MEGPRGNVIRAVAIPLVLLFLYFALPTDGGWLWPAVAVAVGAIVAVIPITVRRVERITQSDAPMAEALEAVALMVSMLIVTFAAAYHALARSTDQFPAIETRIDALYFTITTLATVGFGDLVPVGQAARAMVAAQIVVNLTVIGGSLKVVTAAAAERRAANHADPA